MPLHRKEQMKKTQEQEAKLEARKQILKAANRVREDFILDPLLARHIEQAVCIVRRRQLVDPEVLVTAGFNATER